MPNVKFKSGEELDLPASVVNGNLYAMTDTNKIAIDIDDSRIIVETPTNKQDTLVSGANIKTINGNTLLGAGDITVHPEYTIWNVPVTTSEWTLESDYMYYKNVSVAGITVNDSPWVDLKLTGSSSTYNDQIVEYRKIIKIDSYNDYIRLCATELLSSSITLVIKN